MNIQHYNYVKPLISATSPFFEARFISINLANVSSMYVDEHPVGVWRICDDIFVLFRFHTKHKAEHALQLIRDTEILFV